MSAEKTQAVTTGLWYLITWGLVMAVWGVGALLIAFQVKIRSEEALLTRTFGAQYIEDKRRVPQLVPWPDSEMKRRFLTLRSRVASCATRLARALFVRRAYNWAIILYALLLFPSLSLLTAANHAWPERLAAIALVVAVAVLGWLVTIGRGDWQARVDRMLPLLLVLLALSAALTWFEHGYVLLTVFVVGYAFRYLPARWGFLIAGMAVVLIFGEQVIQGGLPAGPESLLQASSRTGWLFFAFLIVGWIAQLSRVSRERQRVIEELHATQGRLAAAEHETGVQEERGRLAREIHDTLAQGLASIVMHLEAAEQSLPPDALAAAQHLDQARRAARDNLAEARRFVWALQPQALERDALPEALAHVTDRWSDENRLPVAVAVTGDTGPLPPEFEVTLLRVAQEALANISRHAQAHHVNLTLSYMDDQVVMDVNDDGIGFDLTNLEMDHPADRFGLVGMRRRLERLGGRLSIESAPGEGTTLVVALPTTSSERS